MHSDIITKIIRGDDLNAAHALNKGYIEAKGQYVKQLPDDDVIFPEEMERAIAYLGEHPEIDLLVCGGIKQNGNQQIMITAPNTYGQSVEDVFKYGACGAGFIHRRESFAKFGLLDTNFVDIDQEIACRIIANGGIVRFFPGKHYYHAIYAHSSSIQNIDKWNADHEFLKKKYLERHVCA